MNAGPSFGLFEGCSLSDLAALPFGAIGHIVRTNGDPLYRLEADLPSHAERIRHYLPDFDLTDPSAKLESARGGYGHDFADGIQGASDDLLAGMRVRSSAVRAVLRAIGHSKRPRS